MNYPNVFKPNISLTVVIYYYSISKKEEYIKGTTIFVFTIFSTYRENTVKGID